MNNKKSRSYVNGSFLLSGTFGKYASVILKHIAFSSRQYVRSVKFTDKFSKII